MKEKKTLIVIILVVACCGCTNPDEYYQGRRDAELGLREDYSKGRSYRQGYGKGVTEERQRFHGN